MTDPYSAPIRAEDIEDDGDTVSARLDREADAVLDAGTRASGPRPLRNAVREDAAMARDWGRERAARLRGAVETRPVKATLYALGLGVVIGLLVAR
ncbi:MAG: hypothetical protein KKC29_15140 [Alphaproteobacteria bacterium]|jgi:hypothetical protein|nr:hypothetical protein [Alphaproteobacteria bacterium]MBU2042493.1 hypothetical protein [Alphaproteobacteria bacterium]MBU2126279.1 hypothetical protein [Alphaproteobacteria bacterium]MBU2207347.1 hypothetical protein [Alphaproteobacteria bacterium]MBU2292425.1 hypothetical protein [Alphaproteobacteria bacterium]